MRKKMFVLAAQNSQAKVGYFSGKNMTGAVQCSGPKGWNFTLDMWRASNELMQNFQATLRILMKSHCPPQIATVKLKYKINLLNIKQI